MPVGALFAPSCSASGTAVSANSPTNIGAIRSADFTRTLGVETHLEYGAPYTMSAVTQALAYLNPDGVGTGVSTIRDDNLASVSDLTALGAAGYKLDLYSGYNPSTNNTFSAFSSTFSPLVSDGYVALLEGGLEVDNGWWGLGVLNGSYTNAAGQTSSGYAAVMSMSQDLMATFGSKVPIAAPSMADSSDGEAGSVPAQAAAAAGGVNAIATVGNVHFYPHNGNPPAVEYSGTVQQETGWTAGMPYVVTESGFNDCNCTNYLGNDVSNVPYTLNLFLDAFKDGSALTDYYELFDEPAQQAQEAHWGLFNADGTPKPAATALRNMVAILGDASSNAASFATCGTVSYSLSGLPSSGNSLLMQKADGTYDLIVWNDQNDLNPETPYSVGVSLGGTYRYSVFDPITGSTATQSGSGASVSVNVTDHPVIIQLTPATAATAAK